MLVLTRKLNEAIVIGDTESNTPLTRVTVLAIRHGIVRLGFEAPHTVPVHRWEVWKRDRDLADVSDGAASRDLTEP